jgi:hypothetical protein
VMPRDVVDTEAGRYVRVEHGKGDNTERRRFRTRSRRP